MAYEFATERRKLFTEDGQTVFIKDRDAVLSAMRATGAIRMVEAMRLMKCGDTWTMLATMDRMCELGDVYELTGSSVAGQLRVFALSAK